MENKDNQVIITGVHVYDIKWNTTDKTNTALLPVEVILPFRSVDNDDEYNRETIFDVLLALYACEAEDFNFEYYYQSPAGVRKDLNKDGYFVVTRIHRDDLNSIGFDGDNVSNEDMEKIASRMDCNYLNQTYWEDMAIIADAMGIPRKEDE